MGIAHQDNSILTRYFGALMQHIAVYFEDKLGLPTIFLHSHGLPGFHIFDKSANGLEGSIHIDEPYKRCFWPCETKDHFSFTVPIQLPNVGGGLNLYPGSEDDIKNHAGEIPNPEYYPYEVGKMYLHDGKTIHQIANRGDMKTDEYRITIQGHGATLTNGQVVVYF